MIYIGKHQTNDVDDGYMGSGLRIRRAIKKYGLENFEKTILFECASAEEMNAKEAELVNEDFIARDDVYNIMLGGDGGWAHLSVESKSMASKKRWQNMDENQRIHTLVAAWKASDGRKHSMEERSKISKALKSLFAKDPSKNGMFGKTHSKETKIKMRDAHLGQSNGQYGKMWICNDSTHESKSVLKTEPIPDGWRKGRFCK